MIKCHEIFGKFLWKFLCNDKFQWIKDWSLCDCVFAIIPCTNIDPSLWQCLCSPLYGHLLSVEVKYGLTRLYHIYMRDDSDRTWWTGPLKLCVVEQHQNYSSAEAPGRAPNALCANELKTTQQSSTAWRLCVWRIMHQQNAPVLQRTSSQEEWGNLT